MLIMCNLTGLKKFYFLPSPAFQKCAEHKLWYFDIKWLFVQLTIYNKVMGIEVIRKLSDY
jgi:hypothetical protein